ncbi:MAG: hypothetical protein WA892_09835, partial [Ornithinimicrobium sp.]
MNWTIDGLPLHPLLVHAAVVMLAVNGLALLGCIAVPRFRRWLGWGLPLLGVVTAATTWLTKTAGENFLGGRDPVGALADHTHWGGWAGVVSIVLGVTTVAYWLVMSPRLGGRVSWLSATGTRIVASLLAAVAAIAALVVDFLAGHSGATSVWG